MATLTIYGRGTAGFNVARSGDTLIGSNFSSHTGSPLNINADSGSIICKVGNSTYLTITSASIAATAGTVFSGDGSSLTNIQVTSLANGPIGVAIGGTGATTLTDRGVLIGRGTGAVQATSAGTAGQVLTSGGASVNGAYADPVTFTFGSASLSSSPFTLNAANGIYQDIGLSVSLPAAGTYIVTATVRGTILTSSGAGYFVYKLQNSTDATDIANSERMGVNGGVTGQFFLGTTVVREVVDVAAAKTIKVLAARVGATTYTTTQIVSDTDGRSRIDYVRIK